ncbi:PSD1 and planctomycete cytochrome C domain-containing protein [Haloferula sp. A504]|uniref:PSD1 and planctomycete cytochrome C domain-containing protein n=1 Tax=Haloferula sp. A504 TaxID=3373601 RepID=UPI0031C81752|nr:PSD1 and planctomycete cytochrome C domain-containing protein [Verrucomicrobiaceae bacterium E54]
MIPARISSALGLIALAAPQTARGEVDFAHEVVPLLQKHCVECHGGDESKGGFSLNDRGIFLDADVVELGKPQDSYLIELLRTDFEDERMPPPKKQADPLPEEEIRVFERWIAAGLPWEPGFSFAGDRYEAPLKPRRPELPAGPADAHPIDLLLGKWFEENGVEPPHPLDDSAFLRRVSFDLIGLPPTPEELAEFLSDDSPDKRQSAIHDLLGRHTDYADHWLTFWNDLLRNAYDGTGFITGGRTRITGWLYGALHTNRPYDEFVRELVAPGKEARGFIDGIQWRGEVNSSQTKAIQFSQNVSQVFLGINMKCASCHDSFVDQWKLEDAYSLAAIYSNEPLELHRCDKPTGEKALARWIYPELGDIDASAPRDERLKQLADLIVHPENGRTARTIVNRLWQRLMGRGIVDPVDAMDTEPWNVDLLDYLATRLVDEDYDLKAILELIVTSEIYQSRSVNVAEESKQGEFRGPVMKRLTAEQFVDAVSRVTGSWPQAPKGGKKGPQTLEVVAKARGLGKWEGPVRASLRGLDAFQAALGRPNRDQVVSTRPDLLSTLEAIHLANGPEFASMLREGAAALLATKKPADELVDHVYLAALGRRPDEGEKAVAVGMLGEGTAEEGLADFLWTVFVQPEFFYIQ